MRFAICTIAPVIALSTSSACAGARGRAATGPEGAVGPMRAEQLLPVFAPVLDATVGDGDYAVVLQGNDFTPTPEAPIAVQTTRLLADDRSIEFNRASTVCPCVDPYQGPTRAGVDVDAGACDWVASLTRDEAHVSFRLQRVDLERGSATVRATWLVYTPDRGEEHPCSYARVWQVDLARVNDGWEVVSAHCHFAAGRVRTVADGAGDLRPDMQTAALARMQDPRPTGCRGAFWWPDRRDAGS